jgi:hypothetical protein
MVAADLGQQGQGFPPAPVHSPDVRLSGSVATSSSPGPRWPTSAVDCAIAGHAREVRFISSHLSPVDLSNRTRRHRWPKPISRGVFTTYAANSSISTRVFCFEIMPTNTDCNLPVIHSDIAESTLSQADCRCDAEHRLGSPIADRMPRRGGNWGLSRRDAAPPDRGGRCPAEP